MELLGQSLRPIKVEPEEMPSLNPHPLRKVAVSDASYVLLRVTSAIDPSAGRRLRPNQHTCRLCTIFMSQNMNMGRKLAVEQHHTAADSFTCLLQSRSWQVLLTTATVCICRLSVLMRLLNSALLMYPTSSSADSLSPIVLPNEGHSKTTKQEETRHVDGITCLFYLFFSFF
jgi:hypothetical protein